MTGRHALPTAVLGLALACLVAGCESPGPLLSRQTTLGTLKTSVSQLEFQNEQLQKQIAGLKSDNRRLDDRLAQEQAENDDLANRLSDDKGLLGSQGQEFKTGSRSKAGLSDDVDELPPARVRRSNSRRQPPTVIIPGRMEPAREREPADGDVGMWDPPARVRKPLDERWLPVARGTGAADGTVK
jgi:outer membrane murein-binding lipoprotein Lpp